MGTVSQVICKPETIEEVTNIVHNAKFHTSPHKKPVCSEEGSYGPGYDRYAKIQKFTGSYAKNTTEYNKPKYNAGGRRRQEQEYPEERYEEEYSYGSRKRGDYYGEDDTCGSNYNHPMAERTAKCTGTKSLLVGGDCMIHCEYTSDYQKVILKTQQVLVGPIQNGAQVSCVAVRTAGNDVNPGSSMAGVCTLQANAYCCEPVDA